jgi:hypothetical protein
MPAQVSHFRGLDMGAAARCLRGAFAVVEEAARHRYGPREHRRLLWPHLLQQYSG